MVDRCFFKWCVLVIMTAAVPMVIGAGCSGFANLKKAGSKIARDITSPDPMYDKKIGIARIAHSGNGQAGPVEKRIQAELLQQLSSECSRCSIVTADTKGYADFLSNLPINESGAVDNFQLAAKGRMLGLNATILVSVSDIRYDQENCGWLWFKSKKTLARVNVSVEVYSSETGAKLLDECISGGLDIEESDEGRHRAVELMSLPQWDEMVGDLIETAAEKISTALDSEPWKGYIVEAEGKELVISSGKNAGLASGDLLDVYECARIINGTALQKFFAPGKTVGKIRITEVFQDRSRAITESDQNISVGCVVIRKQG